MQLEIKQIPFDKILPIWQQYLWPGRKSTIEQWSAIEYSSMPYSYNVSYMGCNSTFFALFADGVIAGVNSGHDTGESYRSRGLYVFEQYRGHKFGNLLLEETIRFARNTGHKFIWSMPRKSSFKTYESVGFVKTSDWFPTETSDFNAYASIIF